MDVKNAFFNGDLHETVYLHQPPSFRDSTHPGYVCKLRKTLYGLKHAPSAWYCQFASFACKIAFSHINSSHYLSIYHHGNDTGYIVLLYVDDIVLTASSEVLRASIMS